VSTRAETLLQRIEDKALRGHRGDPVGTIAFYGPDSRRANKLVVGFSPDPDAGITETQAWTCDGDVREDAAILSAVLSFLGKHEVRSVVMTSGVFGCPHEEGKDYPQGSRCEVCEFWKDHDREVPVLG
jgi:hypothetical protein